MFKKLGNKTFSSLKIRNYRLYFIGQAISLCGTWMQLVAQSWLVIQLTGSGTVLGVVMALQSLPMLLLGPYGGVLVDRFPRRKLLYITQSVAGLLALILGILVITGLIRVWMIYLLALGLGLMNVIDNPARQKFSLEMVGKDEIANAIPLNATLVSLARAIGPAIAGALIFTVGLASCFFINAASFIAVLIALFMMREKEMHLAPLIPHKKGQLSDGFRYVKSNPLVRDTLLMIAIIGTLSFEFTVSLPLFAKFTFNGNEGVYTIIITAFGIGSMVGGLFAASRRKTAPRVLFYSALFFGLSIVLASIAPTLLIAIILLMFVGAFSIYFTSLALVILQLESSHEMRGRVMSLWAVGFFGSTVIGGPIIGWIGEYAGPRWSLAVGGFAAIIAAGVGISMLKKGRYIKIPKNIEIKSQ